VDKLIRLGCEIGLKKACKNAQKFVKSYQKFTKMRAFLAKMSKNLPLFQINILLV